MFYHGSPIAVVVGLGILLCAAASGSVGYQFDEPSLNQRIVSPVRFSAVRVQDPTDAGNVPEDGQKGVGLDDESFNRALHESFQVQPVPMGPETAVGRVVDEEGHPLEKIQCTLLRRDGASFQLTIVGQTTTDRAGRFAFEGLPTTKPILPFRDLYIILLQSPGRASREMSYLPGYDISARTISEIVMPKASVLRGVVTDNDGEPIPNVLVRQHTVLGRLPIIGFRCAYTNERGEFQIEDLEAIEPLVADGERRMERLSRASIRFEHPDFVRSVWRTDQIPNQVKFQLQHGGSIRGRVVDLESGVPRPGVVVFMNATRDPTRPEEERSREPHDYAILTDEHGWYELTGLPEGWIYNVKIHDRDATAIAQVDLRVRIGQTTTAPDLERREGGFLVGRLVDGITGEAFKLEKDEVILLGVYGASRPIGGSVEFCAIDPDGTFRMRLAPGTNFVYQMSRHDKLRLDVGGPRVTEPRIEVRIREGEETVIEINAWRD